MISLLGCCTTCMWNRGAGLERRFYVAADADLGRQPFAALGASPCKNAKASDRTHALAEAMATFAHQFTGLISSLHRSSSIPEIGSRAAVLVWRGRCIMARPTRVAARNNLRFEARFISIAGCEVNESSRFTACYRIAIQGPMTDNVPSTLVAILHEPLKPTFFLPALSAITAQHWERPF